MKINKVYHQCHLKNLRWPKQVKSPSNGILNLNGVETTNLSLDDFFNQCGIEGWIVMFPPVVWPFAWKRTLAFSSPLCIVYTNSLILQICYIYMGYLNCLMAQTNLFAFVWNVPYGWECDIGHEFWGGVGCNGWGGGGLGSSLLR